MYNINTGEIIAYSISVSAAPALCRYRSFWWGFENKERSRSQKATQDSLKPSQAPPSTPTPLNDRASQIGKPSRTWHWAPGCWASTLPSVPVVLSKVLHYPVYELEGIIVMIITIKVTLHLNVRRKFRGLLQRQSIFRSKCELIEIIICIFTGLHIIMLRRRDPWCRHISLLPIRNLFPQDSDCE